MLEIKDFDYHINKNRINEILSEHQQEHEIEIYKDKALISFSVFSDDDYAGGLVAERIDESIHIERLGVHKNYRAQGLGSKLLNQLIDFAKEQHCLTITLTTLNHQGKEFYLKHGFKLLGEIKNVPKKGHSKFYMYFEL